jgi:hypothetical protein
MLRVKWPSGLNKLTKQDASVKAGGKPEDGT